MLAQIVFIVGQGGKGQWIHDTGHGKSKTQNNVPPKQSEDTESDNLENKYGVGSCNPMLNYVNSLSKIPSYADLHRSRFKRTAIKVQATSAVTKLFKEAGNQKHGKHWKTIIQ